MALAVALVVIVALVVWRVEVLIRAFLPDVLAQRAQAIALDASVRQSSPQRVPLPPDLAALASRETEPWAQEQLRALILDEYEESQDWDRVRANFLGATA